MASVRASLSRQVAQGTGSLLAARVVVAAATLATLPIVYGGLGAHTFGVWALLGLLCSLVLLVDLGLGPALIREVAQAYGEQARRRARAALGLGLLCGVGIGLVAIVATLAGWPLLARFFHLTDPVLQAREAALWLMAGVLADRVSLPWRAMLAGTQRYAAIAAATGLAALLGAAFSVLVIHFGGGLAALGAATAASSAICTALLTVLAYRTAHGLTPRSARSVGPTSGASSGTGCRCRSPGRPEPAPSRSTRSWSVARSALPPSAVWTSACGCSACCGCRPTCSSRCCSRSRWPRPPGTAGTGSTGSTCGPPAISPRSRCRAPPSWRCAQPLVEFWMGHDVPWAAASVAILAPGYAVGLVVGVATMVTRAEGRPARETAALLVAFAMNVALIYPLLRLVGPLGAPVSTLVAVIASNAGFVVYFHRSTNRPVTPVLRAMCPGAVAGGVGAVAGWLVMPYLPDLPGRGGAGVTMALGAVVVLLVAAVTLAAAGFFDSTERARLAGLLHRCAPTVRQRRRAARPLVPEPPAAKSVAPPEPTIEKDEACGLSTSAG